MHWLFILSMGNQMCGMIAVRNAVKKQQFRMGSGGVKNVKPTATLPKGKHVSFFCLFFVMMKRGEGYSKPSE